MAEWDWCAIRPGAPGSVQIGRGESDDTSILTSVPRMDDVNVKKRKREVGDNADLGSHGDIADYRCAGRHEGHFRDSRCLKFGANRPVSGECVRWCKAGTTSNEQCGPPLPPPRDATARRFHLCCVPFPALKLRDWRRRSPSRRWVGLAGGRSLGRIRGGR